MFFEFQKLHGLPATWPVEGLTIDACTAFMTMVAEQTQGLLESKITKNHFMKLIRIFGDLMDVNCTEFKYTREFRIAWNTARENIGRSLTMTKRPVVRFGSGDIRKFMSHMLST